MTNDSNPQFGFDHEKLDVYRLELAFLAWVTPLLHEVRNTAAGFHREVCDQLDRASLSALLNTAEGNSKRQGQQRAKFFDDARGSAVECAACLDALVAKRLTGSESVLEGKAMLVRVVAMLTKLVERFDAANRLKEDETPYLVQPSILPPDTRPRSPSRPSSSNFIEDEDEDEHEHENENEHENEDEDKHEVRGGENK
jgi:four helix bundle protein